MAFRCFPDAYIQAYLFDRRHAGRHFYEEWGRPPSRDDVTTCVRRFGRTARGPHERRGLEHITGAKIASSNGHEVLLCELLLALPRLHLTRPQHTARMQSTSIPPKMTLSQPVSRPETRPYYLPIRPVTSTKSLLVILLKSNLRRTTDGLIGMLSWTKISNEYKRRRPQIPMTLIAAIIVTTAMPKKTMKLRARRQVTNATAGCLPSCLVCALQVLAMWRPSKMVRVDKFALTCI